MTPVTDRTRKHRDKVKARLAEADAMQAELERLRQGLPAEAQASELGREGVGAAPSIARGISESERRLTATMSAFEKRFAKSDKPWALEMRNAAREALGWPKL